MVTHRLYAIVTPLLVEIRTTSAKVELGLLSTPSPPAAHPIVEFLYGNISIPPGCRIPVMPVALIE